MTTEIEVTRKEGNEDVRVELISVEDGLPIGEPAILRGEGQSVSHKVYDSQYVVVTELKPGEPTKTEPEDEAGQDSKDLSDGDQAQGESPAKEG